jgi:hypothetical protein
VQLGGLVAGFDLEPFVADLCHPADGTAGVLGVSKAPMSSLRPLTK